MALWPGLPYPLGATWDGHGVNFALASERATRVELCLFDGPDRPVESVRLAFSERTNMVWHGYLPDAKRGQLYGYRVHGAWNPQAGARFNPAKLVLDPYAKSIGRPLTCHRSLFAFAEGSDGPERTDSAPYAPLATVIDPAFDWDLDRRPATPWHETVIYELHVKGFSALDRTLPAHLRGTYLGLASPSSIRRLLDLGVTAVELMPIHAHADEFRLARQGLTNYWGYNTLSYFAPDARFATAGSPDHAVREFKAMVRALHGAGLEVILDVVYNHTCEGDHLGPTLSLRGVDNECYYRLDPTDRSRYEDFTGCGNTLNMQSPEVLQLIMDSLRYWVEEMHVDGFRFDLASALARELFAVDRLSAFFDVIRQDPVISRVKLIAEPWDVGEGGYQVGNFPPGWTEWNGKYRDAVRRFWRGDTGVLPEMATRLAGSSDLYSHSGRLPHASVNFVTAHDGFTLADLVSYNEKHNEANQEGNRDGEPNNLSWNCGVEGPTAAPEVSALRARQRRNFLLTLLVSVGVPMLSGGDEVGRSQRGNNNAYCHDSDLTWTPWDVPPDGRGLFAFAQQLIALRKSQPALRRRTFLTGRGGGGRDVVWLGPDGAEMSGEAWADPDRRALGMLLDGDAIPETDGRGGPVRGDTLLILLSASAAPLAFTLPLRTAGSRWERLVDTNDPAGPPLTVPGGAAWTMAPRSAAVFRDSTRA